MTDWQLRLPVLQGTHVQLREPEASDAASLLREICTPEVCAHVPPPPTTVEGVESVIGRGIEWRRLGRGFCFVVQPTESSGAVGLIQFLGSRSKGTEAISTHVPWEWGFGIGSRYWGTGLFLEAASMAMRFAFETVGLQEIEAWVVQQNHRANAALAKLGARSILRPAAQSPDGRIGDFVKWTNRRTAV